MGRSLPRNYLGQAVSPLLFLQPSEAKTANKRMAVTLILVFFFLNKRWLDVRPEQLYKIACNVAEDAPALSLALSKMYNPVNSKVAILDM